MHKSRIGEITIDCESDDLSAAVSFWSAALGYKAEPHEDHFHLKAPKSDVQINIQTVTHEPRVHIDFETDDVEAEVARLESLGAKRLREGKRWVVMQTPTGHGICICGIARDNFAENANQWP